MNCVLHLLVSEKSKTKNIVNQPATSANTHLHLSHQLVMKYMTPTQRTKTDVSVFFSEEISLKSTNEYCTCTYIYRKFEPNVDIPHMDPMRQKKETNKFDASLDMENFTFIHLSDSK